MRIVDSLFLRTSGFVPFHAHTLLTHTIIETELYRWCSIPKDQQGEMATTIPQRIEKDSETMGTWMAEELVARIQKANEENRTYRAIIPCGPACWYKPFTDMYQFAVSVVQEKDWVDPALSRDHTQQKEDQSRIDLPSVG